MDRIEALAEANASMNGKLNKFRSGKDGQDDDGHYDGYMSEAGEILRRLESRGFTIEPF